MPLCMGWGVLLGEHRFGGGSADQVIGVLTVGGVRRSGYIGLTCQPIRLDRCEVPADQAVSQRTSGRVRRECSPATWPQRDRWRGLKETGGALAQEVEHVVEHPLGQRLTAPSAPADGPVRDHDPQCEPDHCRNREVPDQVHNAAEKTKGAAGDPKGEVRLCWHAKEVVRQTYDHTDPDLAAAWVDDICRDFADAEMPPEVQRLGRTIKRWRNQIVAWHRSHVSNGPTEAINNLVKRVKRTAFGFRRFKHYRR